MIKVRQHFLCIFYKDSTLFFMIQKNTKQTQQSLANNKNIQLWEKKKKDFVPRK